MTSIPSRRVFLESLAAASLTAACAPVVRTAAPPTPRKRAEEAPEAVPATNIADALKVPRNEGSLPGRFPGRVVEVSHPGCLVSNRPDVAQAARMLEHGLLALTGEPDLDRAWRRFVSPDDVVGLKVNPVAGPLLSTSPEMVAAIISQLEHAGIPRAHIVIWDRREHDLHEAGFTPQRFAGVSIRGTEHKNAAGQFYDARGRLLSEQRIDRDVFYWADCEQEYDKETLPYMVNAGKHSYFSTIVTKEVTKIINLPILKNAGSSVTLCLKNLAYGAITNTGRLHKPLWAETCAQVPCFAPLRDKVVLNIVDGMLGCYDGGPGANPQYIVAFNTMLLGTDPVAVDRVGYEMVLRKRIAMGAQREESPKALRFVTLAATYGLGRGELAQITHQRLTIG